MQKTDGLRIGRTGGFGAEQGAGLGTEQATRPERVPVLWRLYAVLQSVSHKWSKSLANEQYGVNQLENLLEHYEKFAPIARRSGNHKLAKKYEDKLKDARDLLAKTYLKLEEECIEKGNFVQAKSLDRHSESVLNGAGGEELEKEKLRIYTGEALFAAENGVEGIAKEDLATVRKMAPEKIDAVRKLIMQEAKDVREGNGSGRHHPELDELVPPPEIK